MHEISTAFMLFWTIGTFIFSAGFGWAGIRLGQRQMADSIKELKRDMRALTGRLHDDEKNYVTQSQCANEQSECGNNRNYHEDRLLTKISELKTFMVEMDRKREDTRKEMTEALRLLGLDLRAENDRRFGKQA